MENTQEQKTPEQWFQKLKEPYRSKAIKAIVFNHDKKFDSLIKALMCSTNWILAGFEEIITSLNKGETTYLEPETLKPESIELRPEDLVKGEVYTFSLPKNDWKWTFKFKGLNLEKKHDQIEYYRLYVHHDKELIINSSCSHREKYYHATPEEKKLLLGEEEPTDWKSMYNELQVENGSLKVGYMILDEKYNELKAKFDQLDPKGEKVYFYLDKERNHWRLNIDKQIAIDDSENHKEIYEAYCIGKKKSVLVNE